MGLVHSKYMQGGIGRNTDGTTALSAFILISMLEAGVNGSVSNHAFSCFLIVNRINYLSPSANQLTVNNKLNLPPNAAAHSGFRISPWRGLSSASPFSQSQTTTLWRWLPTPSPSTTALTQGPWSSMTRFCRPLLKVLDGNDCVYNVDSG